MPKRRGPYVSLVAYALIVRPHWYIECDRCRWPHPRLRWNARAERYHAPHGPVALPQALFQPGTPCGRGLHGRPHALRGLDAQRLSHTLLHQSAIAWLLSVAKGVASSIAQAKALPTSQSHRAGREERRPSV